MSKPPPSRYRIVERDGRLVTIDTWAKGAPPPPAPVAPLPRQTGPNRARTTWTPPTGTRANPLDRLGAAIVALALRRRDDRGRRLLTTPPSLDKRGPRTIALDADAARRLGRVLAVALLVVLAGIVAAVIDLDLFLPLLVLGVLAASSLGTVAQGPITRFLDTLDDDLPR